MFNFLKNLIKKKEEPKASLFSESSNLFPNFCFVDNNKRFYYQFIKTTLEVHEGYQDPTLESMCLYMSFLKEENHLKIHKIQLGDMAIGDSGKTSKFRGRHLAIKLLIRLLQEHKDVEFQFGGINEFTEDGEALLRRVIDSPEIGVRKVDGIYFIRASDNQPLNSIPEN